MFDAAGFAPFAVSGAQKAVVFGLKPVMAALLGMVTGIGGGTVRDVLVANTPVDLRTDIYAIAALAGAAVVAVLGAWPDAPSSYRGVARGWDTDLFAPPAVTPVRSSQATWEPRLNLCV
jgi:uncharacterized membrane protein YeiH